MSGRVYICTNCKKEIHLENLNTHKNICKGVSAIDDKNVINKKATKILERQRLLVKAKNNGKIVADPNIEIHNTRHDYKVERNLDGSRDYYRNRREQGRYGSHSTYDDMGDESNA